MVLPAATGCNRLRIIIEASIIAIEPSSAIAITIVIRCVAKSQYPWGERTAGVGAVRSDSGTIDFEFARKTWQVLALFRMPG